MKFLNLFLAGLALPLLTAGAGNESTILADLGFPGEQITDPLLLAQLQERHHAILQKLRAQEEHPLAMRDIDPDDPLNKRIVFLGLAGAALVEAIGALAGVLAGLAGNFFSLFTGGDEIIWEKPGHCRIDIETKGGWSTTFKIWSKQKGGDPDIITKPAEK